MRGFRRVRLGACDVPLRRVSYVLQHNSARSRGATYNTYLGCVSIRVRIFSLCPALAHICRTAYALTSGVYHSSSCRSAPGSRGKRRGAWVSWAWLLLLSAEYLPQLKLDDVPYLLTVRYFPIRHGRSFFLIGIEKAPVDRSAEAYPLFSFQFT